MALLAGEPSSRQKAYVLSTLSRFRAAAYESEEAIRLGREALAMAEALGLDEIRAHALNNIGLARVTLGDREGVRDLEQSVEISDETGSLESVRGRLNLGTTLAHLGDLERTFAVHADGRRAAERFGDATGIRWFAIERLYECYWRGLWDEGITASAALLAEVEGAADYYTELGARLVRGWIRLGRGDLAAAQEDVVPYVALGREVKYPQALFPALALGARVFAAAGDAERGVGSRRRAARSLACEHGRDGHVLDGRSRVRARLSSVAGRRWSRSAAGVAHPHPGSRRQARSPQATRQSAADRYAAIGSLPGRGVRASPLGERARPRRDAFVRRVGADGYAPASFLGYLLACEGSCACFQSSIFVTPSRADLAARRALSLASRRDS